MSTERNSPSDEELWRSLASGDVAAAPVSDLDFAAWLEGRLSETAAARIERAVAGDPELRQAALDIADVLGKPLPLAPARLEVRARALVGFDVERQAVFSFEPEAKAARIGLFDWLFAANRNFVLQRAMALTAALAIAVSGFMMGGGIGTTVAEERYAMNWPQTTDTNELTEFLASDGI
jgi:hypothetical protein